MTSVVDGISWTVVALLIAAALAFRMLPAESLERVGALAAAPLLGVLLICCLNVLTHDGSTSAQAFLAFPVLWGASHLRPGPGYRVNRRRRDHVIIVEHQQHRLSGGGQVIDQAGQQCGRRRWLGLVHQRQGRCAYTRRGHAQSSDQVAQEDAWIVVGAVEREPRHIKLKIEN